MGYFAEVKAVIIYVESHLYDATFDGHALERAVGFSVPHIRDIFSRQTGVSLVKYIQQRKISSSAFDLLHTDVRVLDIAVKYGFKNHETYSRAFKRMTGITPQDFRKKRFTVGKCLLIPGVYSLDFIQRRKVYFMDENLIESKNTVLYGVPKVEYGENCTPYPLCLKSCATYLGEDIDYHFIMAATGASFRLTWNRTAWDLSNVDIYHTMAESNGIYGLGAEALGRKFDFMERRANTSKKELIEFIKKHIDQGFPCIALGIIGPPEACIVTGYRDNGDTLLGWNFFQNEPDFSGNIDFDDSGYFITDKWWENKDTQAVMCMGDEIGEKKPLKEIVCTAIEILEGRDEGVYAKGINAYDAWQTAMLDDTGFSYDGNLANLYERRGCIDDAFCCLLDGRGCAAGYFAKLSEETDELKELYCRIAKAFDSVFHTVQDMLILLGGWDRSEENIRRVSDRSVREKVASLIAKAKSEDKLALSAMKELNQKLE